MSVLHTEYLIFSALSYCIFKKDDIGENVFDLLDDDDNNKKERILLKNDIFLAFDFLRNWKAIGKNLMDFLKEWYVVDILDRTDDGNSNKKTGFYGIAFGKKGDGGEYENIVIAYRGSQLFPIKEAYRDFIETDFLIGLGKKPKQFDEGLELYKRIIGKYPYTDVRLTGHSLGGGIAQYVTVMSPLYTKDKEFIPKTVTFNGVGILVENMIKTDDFVNFEKSHALIKNLGYENKWNKIYKLIQGIFIKKINEILVKKEINLSESELKNFYSQFFFITGTSLKEADIKLLLNSLIDDSNSENYMEGSEIVKDFSENKKYCKKVKNFVHSLDFTASFLPHIGRTIYIDKRLEEKVAIAYKRTPLNIKTFQKEMMTYHLFDVFIPYIAINYGISINDGEFYLSKYINILYVSANIRKLIYEEKVSKELLVMYYKQKRNFKELELSKLKNLIIKDLKNIKENFLYKQEIIETVEKSEIDVIRVIWFEVLDRLPSPFEQQDIFDHILYVYNLKKLKNLIKPETSNNFFTNHFSNNRVGGR